MERLAPFAARHHGLFTTRLAAQHGLDHGAVARAHARGEVVALHRGIYRFAAVPPTWESDVLAACWAGGPRAFASHSAAAALHGLPGGHRQLVVVTCPRWRRAHHPSFVVHESKHWTTRDATSLQAIPVAGPALTLLQLASEVHPLLLERALEHALRRALTTIAEIDDLIRRYAVRGRPGIRPLRRLITARAPGAAPTDSERESDLLQLLRRHGLPEPVRQYTVSDGPRRIGTVDLAYPAARIAIEYDSDEFHTGRVATARDSSRRHALIAAGWLPVTAVNADLRTGGHEITRAIRTALRTRSFVA